MYIYKSQLDHPQGIETIQRRLEDKKIMSFIQTFCTSKDTEEEIEMYKGPPPKGKGLAVVKIIVLNINFREINISVHERFWTRGSKRQQM